MMVTDPECFFNGAILMYSDHSYSWGFYCCKANATHDDNENWSQYMLILGKRVQIVDFFVNLFFQFHQNCCGKYFEHVIP